MGAWNGKVQNLGGGGLVGNLGPVVPATIAGYVGSSTDSGHTVAENPNFAVIQETHSLNFGQENLNAYETRGRPNPAACNANSNVPLDDSTGHPAVPGAAPQGRGR